MKHGKPNWFAVVTKPRQERVAHENLQRQGFQCFLPMAENPYQRRSRKHARIIEPLFPRYLFLSAIAEFQNLAPVRSTRGVITMVRFGTKLAIVPEFIIMALKNLMAPGSDLIRIQPVKIEEGDEVRIFDGPLAGIGAIVHKRNSEDRVQLLLEMLGRPISVEVDALMIQRAG